MILACGVLIGILFLEETHESKKYRCDVGVDTGKWLLERLGIKPEPAPVTKIDMNDIEDQETLLEEDAPPGYRTTEGSPLQPSSRSQSPSVVPLDVQARGGRHDKNKLHGVRKAFTKQVVLNIIGFGILA